MKRSISMILCFIILISCKKKDDDIDFNKTDYDEFVEFFSVNEEYSNFINGLETIGAKQVLGDGSYTILLPQNTSQNEFKSSSLLDSETFYLNHIIHGKYSLADLKYRAVNHLDALSMAKLETNNGIKDYITIDLDEDKDLLKSNDVIVGEKLFSNSHYVVYSISNSLSPSRLEDIIVDLDFYKQVIASNTSFNFLNLLDNYTEVTLISLSNDAIKRFLSVNDNSSIQGFVDKWIQNSFIPSFSFSPSVFYPDEQLITLENLINQNTIINIHTKAMGNDPYKGIAVDFEDSSLPFTCFTNYLIFDFDSPLKTVHSDIKVTSTGTLIVVHDFVIRE
ncbi:MAG: fasciclin domain-containing protein [Hyphomicrobiales bacterium]